MKKLFLTLCLCLYTCPASATIFDDWETVSGQPNSTEPAEREDAGRAYDQLVDAQLEANDCISSAKSQAESYFEELDRAFNVGYITSETRATAIAAVEAVLYSMDDLSSPWHAGNLAITLGHTNFDYGDDHYWITGWWPIAAGNYDSGTSNFNSTRDFACSYEASLWSMENTLRANVDEFLEGQEE